MDSRAVNTSLIVTLLLFSSLFGSIASDIYSSEGYKEELDVDEQYKKGDINEQTLLSKEKNSTLPQDNSTDLNRKITADDCQTHEPIRIDNNVDFAETAEQEGWEGNGSEEAPWIIEDYKIDGRESGFCIYIGNVTDHFSIRYCHLSNATAFHKASIDVYDSQNGNIFNNTIVNNTYGIMIQKSSLINVYNNSLLSHYDYEGVQSYSLVEIKGSNYIDIYNNTIYRGRKGIWLLESSNTHIKENLIVGGDILIELRESSNNIVDTNIIKNGTTGINIVSCKKRNKIEDNHLYNNKILIDVSRYQILRNNSLHHAHIELPDPPLSQSETLQSWVTHLIPPSNTVNGDPVYYWKHRDEDTVPSDAGEVILVNCTEITIENQDFKNGESISLAYSSDIMIKNNNISNPGRGIYLLHSPSNHIKNNRVTDTESGIELRMGSSYNIIENNTLYDNFYGIRMKSSVLAPLTPYPHDNTIIENDLSYNDNGFYLIGYSDNNKITNNIISHNDGKGIYIQDADKNNLIKSNKIIDNGLGIYLFGTEKNSFINNLISGNSEGFRMYKNFKTTLKNNTFKHDSINIGGGLSPLSWVSHTIPTSNTVNGKPIYYLKNESKMEVPQNAGEVILVDCEEITVENQNLSGGDAGIVMSFSHNNTIRNNVISNNSRVGVRVSSCRNNTFTGNDIIKNRDGLQLWEQLRLVGILCENNSIYHNNFIDNDNQVEIEVVEGKNNYWNSTYPCGGNYWSDHVDLDKKSGPEQNKEGSDGFADTPYLISQTSDMDHLPLLEPYREGEPPQITDNTPDSAVAGRNFTFDVKVTDNIEVREVRIIHWTDPEKKYDRTMDPVRNCNYELKIKAPKGEDDLHYNILALDVSYNEASLGPFSTAIRDINPPRISINRTGKPTTGDFYTLNATVRDDEGISNVYVDYRTDVTDHVNKSLKNVGEDHYRLNITVPSNATRLKYTVSAQDNSGRWLVSESVEIDVIDNDAPTFSTDELSPPGTGDIYNLSVDINDNIDVERAYVIYWTNISERLNISLKPLDGNTYGADISIPYEASELYYRLSAVDASSNWAESSQFSKKIVDEKPPIARAGTDMIVEKGGDISLNATRSSDNIGITQYIWYVDGEKIEGKQTSYRFKSAGNHTVKLVVKDKAGNTDSSSFDVYVEDTDTRPSASSIRVYTLTALLTSVAVILISTAMKSMKNRDKKKHRNESKKRAKDGLKKLKKKGD